MSFSFIASTGRTATTYIAAVLDAQPGVLACHEGQSGSDKTDDVLPLINLENAQMFAHPEMAHEVAAKKRNPKLISEILAQRGQRQLVDVAYYNPTLAQGLLALHPKARMAGIVRNCADFVRSASTLIGEDRLPVGWADPNKPLTDREKFIAMGRIRPGRGTAAKSDWSEWGTIERNIWLWQETNLLLAQAQSRYRDRVVMCRFETLISDPVAFWGALGRGLEIELRPPAADSAYRNTINKKPAGYQIGPPESWSAAQQDLLANAQSNIDEKIVYEC